VSNPPFCTHLDLGFLDVLRGAQLDALATVFGLTRAGRTDAQLKAAIAAAAGYTNSGPWPVVIDGDFA
jgi:hypothetical protein